MRLLELIPQEKKTLFFLLKKRSDFEFFLLNGCTCALLCFIAILHILLEMCSLFKNISKINSIFIFEFGQFGATPLKTVLFFTN